MWSNKSWSFMICSCFTLNIKGQKQPLLSIWTFLYFMFFSSYSDPEYTSYSTWKFCSSLSKNSEGEFLVRSYAYVPWAFCVSVPTPLLQWFQFTKFLNVHAHLTCSFFLNSITNVNGKTQPPLLFHGTLHFITPWLWNWFLIAELKVGHTWGSN